MTFFIHLSIVLLSSSLIWASCSKIFYRPTDHELIASINGWSEEVRRLGKNPKTAVIAPEAWHNGEEKYIAITQSSHDLHCLNMIRRGMFKDYYFNGTISWALEQHLMHCLHSLLQSLQCRYSTDIYLSAWVEGQEFAVVDFNISRQCLSYDEYMNEWTPRTEHSEEEFYKLRAPPGAIFQPASVF
ncbi:hypothetical protein MKX07_007836 [Trichoderma sp. CBMAI-0711]|nr:hypothetical protein MKX07_007836 [Trichoderma sp. CBMAI-0711]